MLDLPLLYSQLDLGTIDKSCLKTNKKTCEVAINFNRTPHILSDFTLKMYRLNSNKHNPRQKYTLNHQRSVLECTDILNNSRHLARKYARIFVRGHYLFREANSFPRAKLEENCELRGTDNVQGQISVHIFEDKWRLLCLLSFKYFSHSRARGIC